MANLALRTQLDDANLQANLLFKKTGMSPVQPTDTRTTAERMADVEQLKIIVRSKLSGIADGPNANGIINGISTDELRFLANSIDHIIAIIKPKYKYGVDSAIFIPFLRAYIAKEQATHGVEFNLQQATGAQMIANTTAMLANMATRAEFDQQQRLLRDISTNSAETARITRAHDAILRDLPTRAELRAIDAMQDDARRAEIQTMLNEAMSDIPTKTQISRLNDQLRLVGKGGDNRAILEQYERQLSLIAQELAQVKAILSKEGGGGGGEDLYVTAEAMTMPALPQGTVTTPELAVPMADRLAIYREHPESITEWVDTYMPHTALGPPGENAKVYLERRIRRFVDDIILPKILERGSVLSLKAFGLSKATNAITALNSTLFKSSSVHELRDTLANMNQYVYSVALIIDPHLHERMDKINKSYRGSGISVVGKAGKGRMGGRGISTAPGIAPSIKWISFGKFKLDATRLMDNHLVLRTHVGSTVTNIPTRRISPALASILTTLTNDTQPNLDDMYKLSDEDKRLLNDLMKRAHLIGKGIAVPSHDKTDDNADIKRFEIMQGELGAGNDSHELIKSYKLQILLLLKKGLLRKPEANDHLMQLALMGY